MSNTLIYSTRFELHPGVLHRTKACIQGLGDAACCSAGVLILVLQKASGCNTPVQWAFPATGVNMSNRCLSTPLKSLAGFGEPAAWLTRTIQARASAHGNSSSPATPRKS
jgi:hypothetical protein